MAGRPSSYSAEVAELILTGLANGQSMRTICEPEGMPDRGTVRRWEDENAEFAARCARARVYQAEALADDMADVCARVDDESLDAKAAGVILGNMQWRAERMSPKRWGNRLELDAKLSVGEGIIERLARAKARPDEPGAA